MDPNLCATIGTFSLIPQLRPEAPGWAQYVIYLQSFAADTCPSRSSGAVFDGCGGGVLPRSRGLGASVSGLAAAAVCGNAPGD